MNHEHPVESYHDTGRHTPENSSTARHSAVGSGARPVESPQSVPEVGVIRNGPPMGEHGGQGTTGFPPHPEVGGYQGNPAYAPQAHGASHGFVSPPGYGMPGYPPPYSPYPPTYGLPPRVGYPGWSDPMMPGAAGPQSGAHSGAHSGAGHHGPVSQFVEEIASGGNGLNSLTRLLNFDDTEFWKGALVGAAASLLFSNQSVQNLLFGSGKKVNSAGETDQ